MPQFRIGDRAIYVVNDPRRLGKVGTIINNSGTHLIEFDEEVGAHDGNGTCRDGHGWYCSPTSLRHAGDYNAEPVKREREW
jgi:hypothetical protein